MTSSVIPPKLAESTTPDRDAVRAIVNRAPQLSRPQAEALRVLLRGGAR